MRSLLLVCISLFGIYATASVDCPSDYPNGRTLKYSDGSMNFPNGRTFRYSDGSMNYPNGRTLRYSDGSMNYETGRTLMYKDGSMNYPDGRTLRYADGSLRESNGATNNTGSIALSTEFDTTKMRIVARTKATSFQVTIPFGNGLLLVEFDEKGNVECVVEGGDSPTEFRVDGNRGSAYVTVKPGQNAKAVKEAVQKALDGN